MPRFFSDDGSQVEIDTNGCLLSDFDHYGDMEAFGVHPDWQRQLTKFASVQDRLREWNPHVMDKLTVFSCMAIKALDLDAIRIDKATQVTVDALAEWSSRTRQCASDLGKKNFFIPGEVTGGDSFGALYMWVPSPIFCGIDTDIVTGGAGGRAYSSPQGSSQRPM